MKKIMMRVNDIRKTFAQNGNETPVLDNVSVDIYEGDFTVVMGASGAGKSTFLYALSGMDKVTGGSVKYKEHEVTNLSEKKMAELRAREFGFVFQQTLLVSNLSLYENITVAGYVNGSRTAKEVENRAAELLEQMNVGEARNRLPSQVSGGEAQRAAIARAMINAPGVIFADEPTGALNRSNTDEILKLLYMLNENGQSILMVTHDVRAAIRGTRLLYMEDGKILAEMTLPAFKEVDARDREIKVNTWLSSLHW